MTETAAGRAKHTDVAAPVPFRKALWVWARIALLSFGGPAGQIAVMHRILVEEQRWIGESRFLHALNYCMLLPGPEAQQLATYIGWLMHRTKGGLAAGLLFILPGLVSILALSFVYALYGKTGIVSAVFFGLKTAVLAIVLQAVVRIGSRALKSRGLVAIAIAAFLAIFVLDVPFPLIVLAAAFIGYMSHRAGVSLVPSPTRTAVSSDSTDTDATSLLGEQVPAHAQPNLGWSLRVSGVMLLLWLGPVVALAATLGPGNVFSQIGIFFSKMAVVTFGGAYAALAYVAQEGVSTYGWLQPGEMLDGLGMAETTPGPLIMVVQFVGFLGALREPGGLPPLLAATLGALLTTWVTFVPCFLWIFLGAPFIERLRNNTALSAAMTAVTAAVVGVILNLAVWFALHTLFGTVRSVPFAFGAFDIPVLDTARPAAWLLTLAALIAIFRFKLGMLPVLAACSLAGAALYAMAGVTG